MCDPLTAIGGGMAIYGALSKGAIGSRNAGIQGDIARANVTTLNQQAELATEGADLAYAKERLVDARISSAGEVVMASQRRATQSRHFDPSYGSPLVIAAYTASQVKSDLDIARAGAAIEAADSYARAANFTSGALGQLGAAFGADMRGDAATQAGYLGAGTAFLNAAGSKTAGRGGGGNGDWLSNPFS